MHSRRSATAARISATVWRSVAGPCRKRQLCPTSSSDEYPLIATNARFANTIGLSARRGSVTSIGMRVVWIAAKKMSLR